MTLTQDELIQAELDWTIEELEAKADEQEADETQEESAETEVKKHPVDLDKGVGIIPYIYKNAYDYYYALYLAEEENKNKNLDEYIPKDIVVTIKAPQRQIEKRKLFSFLDEEDN